MTYSGCPVWGLVFSVQPTSTTGCGLSLYLIPNERRYSTLSCSSASRHEGTVVITTTVASVIAAIHAA
jgi:hypothetical protein